MKEIIINFFKSDRSYEGAIRLIIKYSNKVSLKKQLNVQPETPHMKGVIFEELRELAGISHDNFEIMIKNKVKPAEIKEAASAAPAKNAEKIPEVVVGVIKLRKEYPFLSKPDCPDQLKILVADKITSYEQYVQGHKDLFDSEKILQVSGPTVEAFLNNRKIFDELNYYKNNGKLLGQHAVFGQNSRIDQIQKMIVPELVKLKDQLTNNIDRTKKKIKVTPKHPETKNRKARVSEYETELKEVKKLLNLPAGKK